MDSQQTMKTSMMLPDDPELKESFAQESEEKIEVMLNAVGKAPKLRLNRFKVKRSHTFTNLIQFVRTQLEKGQVIQAKDSLFLYINSQFSPPPNERIHDLYENYKVGNLLVVNYALTEAWG